LITRDIDFDTAYPFWPALIYIDGACADSASIDR
jgi:hypothetical protein